MLWPKCSTENEEHSLKQLISQASKDVGLLLDSEQFMEAARLGDELVVKTLEENTMKMLEMVVSDYKLLAPAKYEQLSNQLNSILKLFELKIESVLNQLDNSFAKLFSIAVRKEVPEPQWANVLRIFELLYERNPNGIALRIWEQQLLKKLEVHLGSGSVITMVVTIFQLEYNEQQLKFVKSGFSRFDRLDVCQVINFTFLMHEIMTRLQIVQIIPYLLSSDVLNCMFDIISDESNGHVTLKNAAHMISLISNHYSIQFQNADPDNEIQQQNFESTEFYYTLIIKLPIIAQLLQKSKYLHNRVGLMRIKLVEVIDNLVRISNKSLWRLLDKHLILSLIIDLAIKFKQSDIFISYVEKLILYIFDRCLSDFHPYWAHRLVLVYKLYDKQLPTIDRQLLWFDRELSDKLLEEGELIKYYDELNQIGSAIIHSQNWKQQRKILEEKEQTYKIVLGEYLDGPMEPPIIVSAMRVEDELFNEPDEIEEPQNIFINCNSGWGECIKIKSEDELQKQLSKLDEQCEEDTKEYDINQLFPSKQQSKYEIPIQSTLRQPIQPESNANINKTQETINNLTSLFKRFDTTQAITEQEMQQEPITIAKRIPLSNSANATQNAIHYQFKNLSNSYSPTNQPVNDDIDLSGLTLSRKNSLQSSLRTKPMDRKFQEFHIDLDQNRKVLKNDNSVIKVDELDEMKQDQQTFNSKLKVLFKKSQVGTKVSSEVVDLHNSSNSEPTIDADREYIGSPGSVDGRKCRSIKNNDKKFIDFLNKIQK